MFAVHVVMSAASENIKTRIIPKQPLKRVEIPLSKFKDVAVPHYVDLLKKHKANIEKFQHLGDWSKVHREQINATRLIKQLKQLLYDMDLLRSQVQDSDLPKFDKLTAVARRDAQNAIEEYLVLNPQGQTPLWILSRSRTSSPDDDSEGEVKSFPETPPELVVQLSKSLSKEDLAKQEECLKSWERLQTEVQDIHQLFEDFSHLVQEQKQDVDQAEKLIEETAENVTEGTTNLAAAAKYKSTVYPIAGAVIGGCLGGPIGLIAGMKLGGLAALGCGVLGFTGGQLLKRKHQSELLKEGVELANLQQPCNLKGSVSLPQISSKKDETDVPAAKEE